MLAAGSGASAVLESLPLGRLAWYTTPYNIARRPARWRVP
jgi:hypothetical protein